MRLTVSLIPESAIEEELKLPIALYEGTPEEEVHVHLKASKFGDRVFVKGMAASVVPMTCSRCLKTYVLPLEVDINAEYVPYRESAGENEYELTGEEMDVSLYQNDEIDIANLVREQILLAFPMKPLCKPDCRGICPACGKNLNEMMCKCGTDKIDSRLEPLKKIKESLGHQTSLKNKDT